MMTRIIVRRSDGNVTFQKIVQRLARSSAAAS
jgi:hypothetical protein